MKVNERLERMECGEVKPEPEWLMEWLGDCDLALRMLLKGKECLLVKAAHKYERNVKSCLDDKEAGIGCPVCYARGCLEEMRKKP